MPDYTYVEAFGHYYFVTDIVNLDGHRSEVHCTMDPMATYKAGILAYTAFVERSASNFDKFIKWHSIMFQQEEITIVV